jgi:hypothetical protein
VVRGRLWRATNPDLGEAERQRLVKELMRLRSRIGQAMRQKDSAAEKEARAQLHEVKVALGERGPVWWTDGAPDYNRHMARNTPYKEWFDGLG